MHVYRPAATWGLPHLGLAPQLHAAGGDISATIGSLGTITFTAAADLAGVADASIASTVGAITFTGAAGLSVITGAAATLDALGVISFGAAAGLAAVAGASASIAALGAIVFGAASGLDTFPSSGVVAQVGNIMRSLMRVLMRTPPGRGIPDADPDDDTS